MADQDTSAYWRRLLELDRPLPAFFLEKHSSWHRILRPIFYAAVSLPLRFYCPTKIFGLENLPDKPPYILAPNHGSAMDYVVVSWAMGKRKKELFTLTTKLFIDNALTRFWVKVAANAVRVDTEKDFFVALRTGAQVLKAGGSVYIQPEGLNTLDGNLLPFRPGVGVLAVETGVPLVPVYLANTWKALPRGSSFPRPYPVSVSFGKPIEMGPYIEKKKTVQAYDVYKEATEELKSRILDLSRSLC
jgi:1-acyl-sn-glycerol-3-phosphate acyltransferase